MESGFNPYSKDFALIYNLFWSDFIDKLGPKIYEMIVSKLGKDQFHTYLDLACGTGQLLKKFADKGIKSWGLDLSENMLKIAEQRLSKAIGDGDVQLIKQDATNFHINHKFEAVTATFDSINHLENLQMVKKCFQRVKYHLNERGLFLFDINTEKTLKGWNFIEIEESEDQNIIYIMQGKYEKEWNKAYSRVFGFIKNDNNNDYKRFDELYYNTIYKISEIKDILANLGFHSLEYYDEKLNPIKSDPENFERVFILAFN